MNETARYPSHLISKSQLGSLNAFSVILASIGRIVVGMGRLVAPCKSWTAETAEDMEPFPGACCVCFRAAAGRPSVPSGERRAGREPWRAAPTLALLEYPSLCFSGLSF